MTARKGPGAATPSAPSAPFAPSAPESAAPAAASSRSLESVGDLPASVRKATRDLILVLADSKRILGIRYSDWILGAPELEAGIAASSMAQDEWGHARILYALLNDFGDDLQAIEHGRPPTDYANLEALDAPLGSWPDFVAANLLVDTALTVQLEAIADGRFVPLVSRVRKQIEEERFHFAHGVGWLRRLAAGRLGRRDLSRALHRAWRPVLHWFGPRGWALGKRLTEAGVVIESGEALRQRFLRTVAPVLRECRLRLALPQNGGWTVQARLAWRGWDESARRFTRAGPDEETVARARGDRNRLFLMD